jgi:hypothetical protein
LNLLKTFVVNLFLSLSNSILYKFYTLYNFTQCSNWKINSPVKIIQHQQQTSWIQACKTVEKKWKTNWTTDADGTWKIFLYSLCCLSAFTMVSSQWSFSKHFTNIKLHAHKTQKKTLNSCRRNVEKTFLFFHIQFLFTHVKNFRLSTLNPLCWVCNQNEWAHFEVYCV